MSDSRFPDPPRRPSRYGASARASTAAPVWPTVWAWLAAIAAAAVILALVFGYSRSDLLHGLSIEPATNGSAPASSPSGPTSTPRVGDVRTTPADDNQ